MPARYLSPGVRVGLTAPDPYPIFVVPLVPWFHSLYLIDTISISLEPMSVEVEPKQKYWFHLSGLR
jgi:hypothetical protein